MARNRARASMREGPLAELFRATEAAQRQAEKERELAPYIAAALRRKPPLTAPAKADIPVVDAFGRGVARPQFTSDRDGALAAPTQDPHAAAVSGG